MIKNFKNIVFNYYNTLFFMQYHIPTHTNLKGTLNLQEKKKEKSSEKMFLEK